MKNIDLETASLNELLGISTASMRAEAEEVTTEAMAKLREPAFGAREIVMAAHLRKRLVAEREGVAGIVACLSAR